MTRDDIIRMAENDGIVIVGEAMFRFAALVAAAEREACAKVCDDWLNGRDDVCLLADAIRARGEK